MDASPFASQRSYTRTEEQILRTIHVCPQETDNNPPPDTDGGTVPFERAGVRISSYDTSESEEEREGDARSISESDASFDIEVTPTRQETEQDKYASLSPDFGVLVNDSFDLRKDYSSERLWRLLRDLAVPETKRYLARYIRHCVFAAEQWLVRLVRFHLSAGSTDRRKSMRIVPRNFEMVIRPYIEEIVRKVRHRRWACSVSKKYLDALCLHTLCPTFFYDHLVSENPEALHFGDPSDRNTRHQGILRVTQSTKQAGDPFRGITKEVNVSTLVSTEGMDLSPLLWQLELRLVALLYLDSEWISDDTTVRCFPQLADSRVLYSVYRKEECDRPILAYNISQLRSAIGRLYTRWNDLAPSRDLYDYYCFLRDRVAILSVSSLCSTIDRKLSVASHGRDAAWNVSSRGDGRTGREPAGSTRPPLGMHTPLAINPSYAFGKYVGHNLRETVEAITKIPINELDMSMATLSDQKHRRGVNTATSDDPTESISSYTHEARIVQRKKKQRRNKQFTSERKRLYKRLTRKQKLREWVDAKIAQRGFMFDSLAERGDYRNDEDDVHEEGDMFLGDTVEDPSIVRKALRHLGGDIFSSSGSSDEEEEDETGRAPLHEETQTQRLVKRQKKQKKKAKAKKKKRAQKQGGEEHEDYTSKGIAPSDENFFRFYSKGDELMYARLGEEIKDEDICAEVTTHHLIASVKNDAQEGGSANHPRIYSDPSALFADIFLSCLTTDTFLTQSSEQGQSVKCITRTNQSFTWETHAMMCQMEQEIHAWNMLDTLCLNEEELRARYSDQSNMSWKRIHTPPHDMCLHLPEHGDLSEAMLAYAIEFETAKIENVLKMCYSFSRGKRNQFIARNIREKLFSHYLNPGEPEFLLIVCGLKNSSIVPSIIVSRLRQTDVDRLEKIVHEMTIYDVIEEFARFNKFEIDKKNIASHQHAKYLFELQCRGMHQSRRSRHRGETNRATNINAMLNDFSMLSIQRVLDVHLEQPLRDNSAKTRTTTPRDESMHEEDYPVDSRIDHLRRIYEHDNTYRFLCPDISVPWQSPRGLVRVLRVIMIECINFYMKEISHLLDARSFFFNPWMTIQVCNNPTFTDLYNIRSSCLCQHEISQARGSEQEERMIEEEEHSGDRIPTHDDIASLIGGAESRESLPSETVPSADEEEIYMCPFTPEFTVHMRARLESVCMRFYHECPIVLQCMTGCFLWYPRQCTTQECVGADSLLGLHAWLYAATRHLSRLLLPELLVQTAFYVESSKSRAWPAPRRSFHSIEGLEELADLYASMRSIYHKSEYADCGIQYRQVLMLLSNMENLGNRGAYSILCQHLCSFIVQMDVMLFPHILESFSIHIQHVPARPLDGRGREHEESVVQDRSTDPSTLVSRGARPVNPSVHYVDATEPETRRRHDDDSDEELESVAMFFPKGSDT